MFLKILLSGYLNVDCLWYTKGFQEMEFAKLHLFELEM